MRILFKPLAYLLSVAALATATVFADDKAQPPQDKNEYVEEAPLPEGWPKPGPYNAVVEKKYPAYRGAFTTAVEDGAFWKLYAHITENNIPMTAPVEKSMSSDGDMKMSAMGFLYQSDKVGKLGPQGQKVEVKDMPALTVLTYAWIGDDTDDAIRKARTLIDAELQKKGVKATQYRVLGYNGPSTPANRKTYELQAVLGK